MASTAPAAQHAAEMPLLRLLALALAALSATGCAANGGPSTGAAPASPSAAAMATGPTPEPSATTHPTAAMAPPERTIEESGGFRMTTLSSAACTADAPVDWTLTAPDRSDRADLFSPDGSLYAGYGIQAINTTLAPFAPAYDAPLNDPDLYSADPGTVAVAYSRIVAAAIGATPDVIGDELYQVMPDYLLATVSGSTHRGAVFFRAGGFPGDGVNYTYALPMYFALTSVERWDTEGLLVARIAASIRCSTQFQPPDDYPIVEAGEAGTAGDENGADDGYNPQLGTEYANDPGTGENYLVDPSINWSETGPDGPGYYVQKGGGDYQKLEPGRIG